jgi:hypothetical protein
MKILILVLSYNDGELYTNFYNSQKETWDSLSEDNIKTYYYFGNSDENYIDGDNIYLKVENSLKNCGILTIEVFKMIFNLEFDYIFRTNSSSYIDKKILKEFLKDKAKEKFYCGIIGQHNSLIFCSGSGYFLSKDLVELLINNSHEINHNYIDDVAFGEFLTSKKINLVQSERFDVLNESNIPTNFFHYRLKTVNRFDDIKNMKVIFSKKCNL